MGQPALKTSPLCAADRRSIAYFALSKAGSKRADRDQLLSGAAYEVDLVVTGKIGRGQVKETVVGKLCVAEDSERNKSTACPQADLLACCVAGLDKPARDRLFKSLRDAFRARGSLPTVEPAVLADCHALLTELRSTTAETQRGAVTFLEARD